MSEAETEGREPGNSAVEDYSDRRREPRYEVAIPIEISGVDRNGKVFRERAVTDNASNWGCAFLFPVELYEDDIISMRVASQESEEPVAARQSLFQVMRVTQEKDGWFVGVWKMNTGDVWGIDLKRMAEQEASAAKSRKSG